ncbi:MAG: hypothetical protein ACQEWM_02640 [Actinomycetota bacterium]
MTQLGCTAEVLAAALLPRRLTPQAARALVAPALVALGSSAAAMALGLAVAVELALGAWGSGAVTSLVLLAALVGPIARLSLGSPPPVALALIRCAPLLRALDLGGPRLAIHWTAAAAAPVIIPTAVLSAVAALVLAAHDEPLAALIVILAAALGALAAAGVAGRQGRRIAGGGALVRPGTMAARRLSAVGVLACLAAASQPGLAAAPSAAARVGAGAADVAAAGATAAGAAAAVWLAGDALAVDARPRLRLQATLVDCGASPVRLVAGVAALGAVATAAGGAVLGAGAAAVAGPDAGVRIGIAAAAAGASALAVLVLEPDPTETLARTLVFALGTAPVIAALLAGASAGWLLGGAGIVATVAVVALARRIA